MLRSLPENFSPEVIKAFGDYDREVTINNFKVACLLGFILMPAGSMLDYFVYPPYVSWFLQVRLGCSLLIALFFFALLTPLGRRFYRVLGVILPLLPALAIALMIYQTDGPRSTYYAGLNLVLLVIGFVLHWTFTESLVAVGMVIFMYFVACTWHRPIDDLGVFFNNFYFLFLTAVIVVTGSYFHSRLRFREFASRFELDANKKMLEESNRKLVELDQIKSRFFANISHELRTPLTLLVVPLEKLKRLPMDSESSTLLQLMEDNAMRLLRLINNLLDLVKLESGKMELKQDSIEIGPFLKGLVNSAQRLAEDKRIRLHAEIQENLPPLLGDRDKIEKIILNLLFNALKFTSAGGEVELAAKDEGENLSLVVRDTGIGIREEDLPHVFARFWQADASSNRKYQGTGIGLALVKELVEAHHGTVSVSSQLGQGTTFTVQLPYFKALSTSTPPASTEIPIPHSHSEEEAPDEWLHKLYRRAELFPSTHSLQDEVRPVETELNRKLSQILIADDEPHMLQFLSSELKSHYSVLEAVDGEQALAKAAQFLPDLIILDMMMPIKDGLEVCRELRDRVSTQAIPIILLTARADEETKTAALSAGASDFLTKPFSVTELHVRIQNLIRSHLLQQELARKNQALASTLDELKETESELVHTAKIASLGRMSAGLIHEINNPLNYINSALFLLDKKKTFLPEPEQKDFSEILHDVQDGVGRVQHIMSELRHFTQPQDEQSDSINLSSIVQTALRFLAQEFKGKVEVVVDVPNNLSLPGNRHSLVQLLINLLQNAFDAVQRKAFVKSTPKISIQAEKAGSGIRLKIWDNGEGIEGKNLDKIFDPFFTTKEVGQGLGLGLSICYRIVQQHQGNIKVQSRLGEYTEFELELPGERSSMKKMENGRSYVCAE